MNYEQFKEEFIDAVKEKLAEQGLDMNVSVNEVKKLNESYEAMTVTPEGARVGVNVSLERFYEAYDEGRPLGEVVDQAVDTVTHGIEQRPDFDIDSLMDYSQMKGKLAMEIVSAEANKEMLENVPHNDNPGAKSQGMKQLMAGGGVALIGTTLVPLLAGLF